MKNIGKHIFFAIALGALVWTVDALLDFLVFGNGIEFWPDVFFGMPMLQMVHRAFYVLTFVCLGFHFMRRLAELEEKRRELSEVNRSLVESDVALNRVNAQLKANEQQLRAADQQLRASEQQLRAANQQLTASNQQLRASETRYRTLFNNMPVGIAVYDVENDGKDFLFIDYNLQAQAMDGVTKEEVLGRNVRQVFPAVVDYGLHAVFEKAWNTGRVCHHPVAFYKDNRLAGWRENFVFKLPTGQLVAAYTDATPLKRSEAKLKTIFESSGDALLVVDASGTVLEANRSSEILFAMRRTKLLGSSLPAVVIESRRDSFRSLLRNIREGSTAGTEVEILQNGVPEPVPVEFMCAVIDWEDGKAVLLNGRSLAWRRRMEQQIEQIQRMESIATLAGGIAHDFNNALAGILNCVNLAEIYLVKEPEKTREKLRTAESAIMDATALTKQLLTFARGGEPVRRVERIEPLLRNAIELSLSGSGVRAEQSFDIGLWPLAIDHGQMMQVFQNILINARQALADKGIVRIKARNVEVTPNDNPLPSQLLHGPYVVVSIADHGPGIAPEFMSRLFDPFFSTKQTGSGLGLTTAYSIIQKHDGGIVVDSEPAKGTQFSIYLPAAPDGILPESEKARTTNGKGRRILVMDDEPIVREVLCEILRHLGYRAVEAPDGESAVSLFRDARERGEPFDAVILDLVIPGGRGGEEILAVLRSIDPTIRAVATSGYSNASVLTNFLDHGFSEAFQKPSTAEEIAGILAKTFND